jgi:hypothetical protein
MPCSDKKQEDVHMVIKNFIKEFNGSNSFAVSLLIVGGIFLSYAMVGAMIWVSNSQGLFS